jgi:LacI family transcriptional regulator
VALLIETSSSWGIHIVEGIARFAKTRGWRLDLSPRGKHDQLSLPADWTEGGIIARVTTPSLAEQIIESGCPAVDVSWYNFGGDRIARCTADEEAAGKMASQHLRDHGLRQMAYCGSWHRPGYCDLLQTAFANDLALTGITCRAFNPPPNMATLRRNERVAVLGHWLLGIKRPFGVFAFDSEIAYQLIEACRVFSIQVPYEVAILSAEHDELFTTIANPPISAIELAPQRVGYEAAALLETLFEGGTCDRRVRVQPTNVLTRLSTDMLAHADRDFAAALQFIKVNAHRSIQVSDIIATLAISRRSLEQKFHHLLGRSPAAEIRRERVERAKQLLRETDETLSEIAVRCGFESALTLANSFRKIVGVAPSTYRKRL